MGWSGLKSNTLTTTSGFISNTVSVKTNLFMISHLIDQSSSRNIGIQFSNDSGSNYAWRKSQNGAADTTSTSTNQLVSLGATYGDLMVGFILNVPNQEKLSIVLNIQAETSGAANAPGRSELVGKWVDTSSSINVLKVKSDNDSSTYGVGSNLSVLGTSQAVDQN